MYLFLATHRKRLGSDLEKGELEKADTQSSLMCKLIINLILTHQHRIPSFIREMGLGDHTNETAERNRE